jgi:hypothetical protein
VHVIGTHVGERAATLVLELDLREVTRTRWAPRMATAQRLKLGLLVRRDHVVLRSERDALDDASVEVKDPGCLLGEVRVAREDP